MEVSQEDGVLYPLLCDLCTLATRIVEILLCVEKRHQILGDSMVSGLEELLSLCPTIMLDFSRGLQLAETSEITGNKNTIL